MDFTGTVSLKTILSRKMDENKSEEKKKGKWFSAVQEKYHLVSTLTILLLGVFELTRFLL